MFLYVLFIVFFFFFFFNYYVSLRCVSSLFIVSFIVSFVTSLFVYVFIDFCISVNMCFFVYWFLLVVVLSF